MLQKRCSHPSIARELLSSTASRTLGDDAVERAAFALVTVECRIDAERRGIRQRFFHIKQQRTIALKRKSVGKIVLKVSMRSVLQLKYSAYLSGDPGFQPMRIVLPLLLAVVR